MVGVHKFGRRQNCLNFVSVKARIQFVVVDVALGHRLSDSPVQTGPRAHPPSYTMGTGSFAGLRRTGRGVDHPLQSSADVKEKVKPYP